MSPAVILDAIGRAAHARWSRGCHVGDHHRIGSSRAAAKRSFGGSTARGAVTCLSGARARSWPFP